MLFKQLKYCLCRYVIISSFFPKHTHFLDIAISSCITVKYKNLALHFLSLYITSIYYSMFNYKWWLSFFLPHVTTCGESEACDLSLVSNAQNSILYKIGAELACSRIILFPVFFLIDEILMCLEKGVILIL